MAVYTSIDNPELYFKAHLYTGNGSSQSISGVGFQPDLLWVKERSSNSSHQVVDAVRGIYKRMNTNTTAGESDDSSSPGNFSSFDSDGFSILSGGGVNASNDTYVAWCWDETATAGFDIVTYTGTGSTNNVSHSLSAVPHVMIVKRRDDDGNYWVVYHHKNTAAPETDYLRLDGTGATVDDTSRWNDTAPTSSVYTVQDSSQVNGSSNTYITYLWSEKQGYSKFGSYTGNGDADGAFIYTGFKPAFIMFKRTSGTADWQILDNKRSPENVANEKLKPNLGDAESTTTANQIDFLSNGVKIRASNDETNGSGSTYIYIAFAEQPLVNSKGIPCNAR